MDASPRFSDSPYVLERYHTFDMVSRGCDVFVSMVRLHRAHPALRVREGELLRCALRELASLSASMPEDGARELRIDFRGLAEHHDLFQALDQRLEAIANRPLSARQAQTLLGITARERLRWTKDGRLPRHGTDFIKRGQIISLATYAVEEIENLFRHPETVRRWRSETRSPQCGPQPVDAC